MPFLSECYIRATLVCNVFQCLTKTAKVPACTCPANGEIFSCCIETLLSMLQYFFYFLFFLFLSSSLSDGELYSTQRHLQREFSRDLSET